MRGIVFRGGSTLELENFSGSNARGVGEVVLEIKASGMCGSDLHWYRRSGGRSSGGHCRS